MSDEINVSVSLQCDNGFFEFQRSLSASVDQAASGGCGGVQEIGTSEESLVVGDVSTAGLAFFRNLDETNFIKIGPDSTGIVDFVKLIPGGFCVIPLATGTVKAIADTAACKLEYYILEA